MSEEMPPRWMWTFDEELEIWFKQVDEQRKERFGTGSSDNDSDVPMMANELAQGRR